MKYCMAKRPLILTYVSLGPCVLHVTKIQMETNLQVAAVGVSSWGTLMGKKDGKSTTLRPMNSLCHETLLSLKTSFHFITLKLHQLPQSPSLKKLIWRIKLMTEQPIKNESHAEQILDDKRDTDTTKVVVTNTTVIPEPPDVQIPNARDENEPLGHGCRVKYPSTRLQDYVKHTIQKLSPSARSSA